MMEGSSRCAVARRWPSCLTTLLWLVSIFPVLAVDRSKFRTCEQGSFCRRFRKWITRENVQEALWLVQPESRQSMPDGGISYQVRHAYEQDAHLLLKLNAYGSGMFRARLTEIEPLHTRYEIPAGDVVIEPPPQGASNLKVVDEAQASVLTFTTADGGNIKVTLQHKPLSISIEADGQLVQRLNSHNFLNFERYRVKGTTRPPDALSAEEGKTIDAAAYPGVDTNGLWEESFGGHTDKKPRGPASFGMDMTFEGDVPGVFGLAEHANANNLELETFEEPVRFFNLDVFEYELDVPMAIYGTIPVMHAIHRAGDKVTTSAFLWLNPSETFVKILRPGGGAKGTGPLQAWMTSESGVMDVVSFLGPTPASVMKQWHTLTGFAPLPPLFALGKHQCRWNYRDEKDVEMVNKNFDKYDLPMDVIWLDIEHTDGKKYFTWHPSYFPTPEKMMEGISASKRKLVTIVDPHIKKENGYKVYEDIRNEGYFTKKIDWQNIDDPNDSKPADWVEEDKIDDPEAQQPEGWNEAEDGKYEVPKIANPAYKGAWKARQMVNPNSPKSDFEGWCWPGTSMYPDFTHPGMRELWAKKFAYDQYTGTTKDVYTWNDMNEPSVFNGPEVTMPRDVIHPYGNVEHRDVHNMYGFYVQRATFEAQLARDPASRPFVLTRSFFVGAHRWGAIWTGDNDAKWDHLRISVPMVMSLALGGCSLIGADVGGFFRHPDKELITRWYQVGALAYPFFRQHAHLETPRREPWMWDEETQKHIKVSVHARYKLLPMWYTAFEEFHREGAPVVRPLWYDFLEDKETHSQTTATEEEIMVSDVMLVRSVHKPMAQLPRVPVYLPKGKGNGWYDYHTGDFHAPGTGMTVSLTIDSVPAYWRAGTIVPTKTRIRRSSSCMSHDPFTLLIFLDPTTKSAKGRVYIDDYTTNRDTSPEDYLFVELTFADGVLSQSSARGSLKSDVSTLVERVEIYGFDSKPTAAALQLEGAQTALAAPMVRSLGPSGIFSSPSKFAATVKQPKIDLRQGSAWSLRVS
mmetsp:Transcript_62451/g.149054  ORF Transcript_62451/g.149054 Transcript_62451/m.149054 type:complete len:1025 (-) Transcript_62451:37-3111(-)